LAANVQHLKLWALFSGLERASAFTLSWPIQPRRANEAPAMLVHGYSDQTRSRNIAQLRRDGYPPKQASAIAYRIQREELRKRSMRRRRSITRRDRGLAYANPTSGDAIGVALGYLGLGAGIGAGVGALEGALQKPPEILGGAVAGGSVGIGVTALGGFIVGLVSPNNRNAGFATAGIGLGGLILINLASNIAANASP
jgi:hypothetical protein